MTEKQQLKKIWIELGYDGKTNIEKEELIQWMKEVFRKIKDYQSLSTSQQIGILLNEYENRDKQNEKDGNQIIWSYEEAISLFDWAIKTKQRTQNSAKEEKLQQQSKQQQQKQEEQQIHHNKTQNSQNRGQRQEQQKIIQEQQKEVKVETRKEYGEEKSKELLSENKEQKQNEHNLDDAKKLQKQQREQYLEVQQLKENKEKTVINHSLEQSAEKKDLEAENSTYGKQKNTDKEENPGEQNEFNELTKKQQDKNNQQQTITPQYQQNLEIIFNYYCRISYGTGTDVTFDQILQKTQIMTLNKFMIFAKEFGVIKLSGMNRNALVELFKKNAQCYKQMNFEQFLSALKKISKMVYGQEQGSEQNNEFEKMLLFLEVNNEKVFKKKMVTLNITTRGINSHQKSKKQPLSYKFKFQPSSKKQVIPQIESKQRMKSQKRSQKNNRNQNFSQKQLYRSRDVLAKESQISIQPRYKAPNTPLPPVPPPIKHSASKISRSENLKSVIGYSNIHKLKMGKEISMSKEGNRKLKLNSVVEQARKVVTSQDNEIERLNFHELGNNLHDYPLSRPSEMSRQSQFSKQSDIPQFYEKIQTPEQKWNSEELNDILGDMEEDDEFLQEHLQRQKKNYRKNKRIEEKIQNLEPQHL